MQQFIRKTWPHILAWCFALAYLVLAPGTYAHFFVHDGQALDTGAQLSGRTRKFQSNIDGISLYDQRGIYQIVGWGFLTMSNALPVEDYERQVVLASAERNYVFTATPVKRSDVTAYFSELGVNLNLSGFSSLIYAFAVEPGSYKIKLVFKNPDRQEKYIDTGRCLTRTPNYLVLEEDGSKKCKD
jgi:hypothetical protein